MAKPRLSHLFLVGVDVGTPSSHQREQHRSFVQKLLACFDRHQVPATWSVTDPTSSVVRAIRATSVAHEVALDWTGRNIYRVADTFQFAAELRASVRHAAEHSLAIQSLVIDSQGAVPYQSLAKVGIRSLRTKPTRAQGPVRRVQPQSLRHGVWGLPLSCAIPASRRMFQPFLRRQIVQQLRAMEAGSSGVFHLVLDAEKMADAGRRGLNLVDRVVQTAKSSELDFARLASLGPLVRRETIATPTRSILRRVG